MKLKMSPFLPFFLNPSRIKVNGFYCKFHGPFSTSWDCPCEKDTGARKAGILFKVSCIKFLRTPGAIIQHTKEAAGGFCLKYCASDFHAVFTEECVHSYYFAYNRVELICGWVYGGGGGGGLPCQIACAT